ncbi:MAG TPA: NAD(P)/FAD-dependent oxidoreductase [Croceibacterium sp.]
MPDGETALAQWLGRFADALAAPGGADWSALFAEECWWRDLVAFTWNIVTLEGVEAIAQMAAVQAGAIGAHGFALDDPALPLTDDNQGWFTFETGTARCRGHVQLVEGKARILLTAVTELIGHEEPTGTRRPNGLAHRAEKGRPTWAERRAAQAASFGIDEQPFCLIVGGGQNGLQLAARLGRLGVPTLVIDAHERAGDCWRKRYPSLHLHDPIFLDHFPYLPFPEHWPLFTPKDRMADWLEHYVEAMDIAYWGGARCTGARYDERRDEWAVEIERSGETLTVRPKHLVLATGLSGAKHIPDLPGAARFAGEQCHSADHRGGTGMAGKRCVVIGSNNSAHDIAVDLWEHGAQVTMIQRSPTIVVRADTMSELAKHLPYANPAIPIDFADLTGAVTPYRPRLAAEKGFSDYLRQLDAAFYQRLAASGFDLWHGEDETGFFMAYFRRAAGYYIDVGGSELVASGAIALARGEIAELTEHGVTMADGTALPADVIVYATGYRPFSERIAALISPEVAARVGPCWGLGSGTEGDPGPWEGELRNMWKPTAQGGLWIQGGNLMQARFHSLHLALQLKARMEGLATPVYPPPSPSS